MNVRKEAEKDAFEFARAQMFYGQGAGTRRKLIKATVDHKADTIPGYLAAFYEASRKQDMAAHAAQAKRIRVTKDVTETVSKNVKGVATGNWGSVSPKVIVVVGVGYLLHKSGYDKVIFNAAQRGYEDVKLKWNRYKQVRRENSTEGSL